MAEIFPNMKDQKHTSEVLLSKEQKEPSQVGQPTCSNSPQKELTWPTPISPQLELGVPILEHDMLEKWIYWGELNGIPRINKRQENLRGIY